MVQVHGDFEGEFEYFACLPGAAVHFGAVGAVAAQDVLVLPVLDMVGDDEVLAGPTHLQAQMHLQRVAVLGPGFGAEHAVGTPAVGQQGNGAGADDFLLQQFITFWLCGEGERCDGLQRLGGIGLADPVVVVVAGDFGGGAHGAHLAVVDPEGALAQGFDCGDVVADEEQGEAVVEHAAHAGHAFGLEQGVADGEGFVDDEDVGVDVDDDGKGQADVHAAGVGFDGLVDKRADVGKGDDVVEAFGDFALAQAQDGGVDGDVFTPGEFGVEAGAELQQCGNAPAHLYVAGAGMEGAADDLQQGGFACAVAPDDAEGLPAFEFEGDVVQGGKFPVVAFAPAP